MVRIVHVAVPCLVACGARTGLSTIAVDGGVHVDAGVPSEPDFLWYVLDETSGTTAHDSSSHHYDVTNLSAISWGQGGIFDGSTCASVDVDIVFRDPPITMTAWLAPASRSDETSHLYGLSPFPPNALSGDIPGSGGYGLGIDIWTDGAGGSMALIETGVGDTTGFHGVDGPFLDAKESFVALVSDSSSSTFYVDGAKLADESANDPPNGSQSAPLHLGCHNDDTGYGSKRFYRGRMRDARVYKRVLAASEIVQLFAAGPVTKAP